MRRVLITGATGFIGRHATRRLLEKGWEVHTLGRSPVRTTAHHYLDLLEEDPITVLQQVEPSHLLHLAWVTDPDSYQTSRDNERWGERSLQLLTDFADRGGSHAVCAGTCLEYDLSQGICTEEVTPLHPATPYAAWKHSLHMSARLSLVSRQTSLSWARFFYLYGPGENPQRLVAHVISSLLQGREAAISAGMQRRDYLFVIDAAAALVALLESSFDGAVNIGSGKAIEVGQLASMAARATGRHELLARGSYESQRNEPTLIEANIDRLKRASGWRPTTTFDEGLSTSVTWWRDQLEIQP